MKMFSARRSLIHRRSLIMTAVTLIGSFSLGGRSQAAGQNERRAARASSEEKVIRTLNLKTIGPARQVRSIRQRGHSYLLTMVSGATVSYPEFNLHFKTDSGDLGPNAGRPVLLSAGMRNDRAYVVFSDTREIEAFIAENAQHPTAI
jgi:hypothetical protein